MCAGKLSQAVGASGSTQQHWGMGRLQCDGPKHCCVVSSVYHRKEGRKVWVKEMEEERESEQKERGREGEKGSQTKGKDQQRKAETRGGAEVLRREVM